MLPPAHYAIGMAAGTLAYKLTGNIPVSVGLAAATHLPLDWIWDEFWDWKSLAEYMIMGIFVFPLILLIGITSFGYSQMLGPWPIIFGLAGIAPDVIDLVVKQTTKRLGLYVNRYGNRLYGWEVFPCHYQSPLYWGQLNGMLSLEETAGMEWLLGIAGIIATYLVTRI
jgi:hypothetical protein